MATSRLGNRQAPTPAPELAEGYPTLGQVLAAVHDVEEIPDTGVRRLEVNAFASGDATYQVWTVDREEATGGYLAKL
jgi:hypothetical protein